MLTAPRGANGVQTFISADSISSDPRGETSVEIIDRQICCGGYSRLVRNGGRRNAGPWIFAEFELEHRYRHAERRIDSDVNIYRRCPDHCHELPWWWHADRGAHQLDGHQQ